jgi:hypothetical protein
MESLSISTTRTVLLSSAWLLVASACGPQNIEKTASEGDGQGDAVSVRTDKLMSCTTSGGGAGTVGNSTNADYTISSIVADGSNVLKIGGHNTAGSTPTPFSGLISLGKGVTAKGTFGVSTKVAYITSFSFDSTGKILTIKGSQVSGGVTTGIIGTITLTGVNYGAGGITFSRANKIEAGPGYLSFFGYNAPTKSFLSMNWQAWAEGCGLSTSVSGTSGKITLNATATGATKVGFYVDGSRVGEDTTAPFSLTGDSTPLLNGSHNLYVIAEDGSSTLAMSPTTTFSTSNAGSCTISITPGSGTISGSSKFSATWSTRNATKCAYKLDSGAYTTLSCAGGTDSGLDASLFGVGSHTVTVKAEGDVGTGYCTSNVVTISR